MGYRILLGHVLEQLATLGDESVQMCVTSPPYWGLRDYGVDRQLGLEKTPEEYVEKMVEVFREVRRVLRQDGTLWLNIGDSYATGTTAPRNPTTTTGPEVPASWAGRSQPVRCGTPVGLKPKDLCLIPERLAIALQAAGWWVRSRIAWCKKSSMPESVTDRPTSAWEHIWLLTKAKTYYYDAEAVRVPSSGLTGGKFGPSSPEGTQRNDVGRERTPDTGTANLRNVWLLGPEPFPDAHFATFPTEIPRRAILAGTSAKGCCPECGAPWERVVERTAMEIDRSGNHPPELRTRPSGTMTKPPTCKTTGWRPTCDHGLEPVACTVLDPFGGAMTTGVVAEELGRNSILIELNPDYAAMGDRRIQASLHVTRRKATEDPSTFKLEFV